MVCPLPEEGAISICFEACLFAESLSLPQHISRQIPSCIVPCSRLWRLTVQQLRHATHGGAEL